MRRPGNPPNPWHSAAVEWLEPPPPVEVRVYEETARSIVVENDSPDIPFRYSVNPYRGCHHGCAYCYARPTHQYLDWGAGSDFETRIVAKVNAADLLRKKLSSRHWRGDYLAFSGVTDCYQPHEASYGLTRDCLEVCRDLCNPVGIITKGALIRRDVTLLTELHARAGVSVYVSIPFDDPDMARAFEPYVAQPARRYETIRCLADAGLPVGVAVAPVIPGLNDSQIPTILERARGAGATGAFMTPLRLAPEVETVFRERLAEAYPLRVEKVMNGLAGIRGGNRNDGRFHARMAGSGPRWLAIEQLFALNLRRLGYDGDREHDLSSSAPERRQAGPQLRLDL